MITERKEALANQKARAEVAKQIDLPFKLFQNYQALTV